jgi:hypothetical protein
VTTTPTEERIRETLHDLTELREHAEAVARLVFELRWPKSRADRTMKADLTWTLEEGTVDVSYYAGHGEDDSFSFPIHYLWSDRETIEQAERDLAEETARKQAEKHAAEEAERQRRRRADYERLKAEFETADA